MKPKIDIKAACFGIEQLIQSLRALSARTRRQNLFCSRAPKRWCGSTMKIADQLFDLLHHDIWLVIGHRMPRAACDHSPTQWREALQALLLSGPRGLLSDILRGHTCPFGILRHDEQWNLPRLEICPACFAAVSKSMYSARLPAT